MKKLMLFSFLMMATLFVHAQRGGGNPEAKAQKQVDRLTEQLNLSAPQQAQLYDLFIARHQNRKAGGERMRDLSEEQREALKAERATAKAAFENQIVGILTPAQYETFKSLPREGGRKGQNGASGKRGNAQKGKGKKGKKNVQKFTPEQRAERQTDRLTEELALDANQQTAVYNLVLNRAVANQKGADWKNLSKEEKAALKGAKQKDKAAFEAELANILTPAQWETYQNMSKKKKGKKGKKNRR